MQALPARLRQLEEFDAGQRPLEVIPGQVRTGLVDRGELLDELFSELPVSRFTRDLVEQRQGVCGCQVHLGVGGVRQARRFVA